MATAPSARSLPRALAKRSPREQRRFQRQIVQRLSFTVVRHMLRHQEMHGDLHPGNIMIGDDGRLHLIDWGNVVSLEGKWNAVWDYLAAAILADTGLLADALIRMSTTPAPDVARRSEVIAALDDTLRRKGITPLTRRNLLRELRRGGWEGLHRRGQAVLQLMSNTQQLGVVIRKDYLHLSRALFAAAGSVGGKWLGLLAVDKGGDLHLCHRFVGSNQPTYGNVTTGIDVPKLAAFVEGAQDRSSFGCKTCRIRSICAGGCYHESYARQGDAFAPVYHYCDLLRDWVDGAVVAAPGPEA